MMTEPCWPTLSGPSSVICMVPNVSGLAALHMVKVPPPLRPTVNVPAVISSGWPGRLPGPAYQHS